MEIAARGLAVVASVSAEGNPVPSHESAIAFLIVLISDPGP